MSLKHWRGIILPHPDVLNGTSQQSEFPADQVRSRLDRRISRTLRVMKANGSPMPRFEMDENRTSFLIRLPVHPKAKAEVVAAGTAQVTAQVGQLLCVCTRPMNRDDLQQILGLSHRENFRRLYIVPALNAGLIEMTIPDKPNSRLQNYRLTAKGRAWLAQNPSTTPKSP